jgi:hypothetical protein
MSGESSTSSFASAAKGILEILGSPKKSSDEEFLQQIENVQKEVQKSPVLMAVFGRKNSPPK